MTTVDAESRRALLLRALASRGRLGLAEAAEQCGVHPMTIRRDFSHLEGAGLARRVRGGVVAVATDDFAHRRSVNLAAKRRIAAKLLEQVGHGATIGIDSSTTVYYLASSLPPDRDVSVVTNGLEAFEALHARPGVRCFLTGGEREEENASLVGPLALAAVANFNLDRCFLSALSVHAELGTSESTLEQAAVKAAMAGSAQTVVLAVDSSKLDTRSRVRSVHLRDVDVLVTELDPADPRLDAYRDAVPEIR